jgi:large subunit ribosomal protein L29|uniref:Large ribosomal subunit protein uL29c n=1 Tax=Baffinella frigidus TaxID=2571260 RepID=A0A7T8G5T9_9CRYP|nr:ribosomal protein L29 [Cryptophyta sp. CCMP2293]
MAFTNFVELKELDDTQVGQSILNYKKELFDLRLQKATRQSFKSHNFKHLKRKISQLLTIERQREQN